MQKGGANDSLRPNQWNTTNGDCVPYMKSFVHSLCSIKTAQNRWELKLQLNIYLKHTNKTWICAVNTIHKRPADLEKYFSYLWFLAQLLFNLLETKIYIRSYVSKNANIITKINFFRTYKHNFGEIICFSNIYFHQKEMNAFFPMTLCLQIFT